MQFHRQGEEPLRDDEISILNGVLELSNKHVASLMTPMKVSVENSMLINQAKCYLCAVQDVVTISADTILDQEAVDTLCVIYTTSILSTDEIRIGS